jgi:hypothetical protein
MKEIADCADHMSVILSEAKDLLCIAGEADPSLRSG